MTIPATIAHAVQQTQEWLKELKDKLHLSDETEALAVLRIALHTLRDRLPVGEGAQFAAQLPTFFRGIYYEGFVPAHVPDKSLKSRQDLLDRFTADALPRNLAPEPMVTGVFALLARHMDPGEIADVIGMLPDDIKGLWPETARTFKARSV